MANINNLKIGSNNPDALMLDKPITKQYGDELIKDYYKYANDAGGYFVHGLTLLPGNGEWNMYWWPWDLGVPSGALKDINGGAHYWGYVQDGYGKNITSGINTSFPANSWGTTGWCAFLQVFGNSDNSNYSDGQYNYIDFGDVPIVVTFSEDFVENATFTLIGNGGNRNTISEDKRTLTIYRVRTDLLYCCRINWIDNSLDFIRQKLTDVIVDVTGLSYHYEIKDVIDYSSVEVWDAYAGSTQVYHKDKTVENCLEKYKYIKEVTGSVSTQTQIIKDESMGDNVIVPIPVDFSSLFGAGKYTSFNIDAYNDDFWDAVKQYAASDGLVLCSTNYGTLKGSFQGCNMAGAITIKVLNDGNIAGDRMFEYCPVSEINFTYADDSNIAVLSSINTLFKSTPNLQTITSTKDLLARDMSGCFEYSGIVEIPGIINYSQKTYNYVDSVSCWCTVTTWFCDGATKLTTIDRYRNATSRDDSSNTIKMTSGYYMFNNCPALVTIDPILDFEYVKPDDSARVFGGCTSLTDARIKNLNHGDWHFDNSYIDETQAQHGTLESFNQDSIEYLFANLKDLTTRNPDLVYGGGSPSDEGWNGNEYAANPDVSAANLYCPSSWDTYITSEMISAANAKGWTIYVNGEVKTNS